jgi:hypothetical protein
MIFHYMHCWSSQIPRVQDSSIITLPTYQLGTHNLVFIVIRTPHRTVDHVRSICTNNHNICNRYFTNCTCVCMGNVTGDRFLASCNNKGLVTFNLLGQFKIRQGVKGFSWGGTLLLRVGHYCLRKAYDLCTGVILSKTINLAL